MAGEYLAEAKRAAEKIHAQVDGQGGGLAAEAAMMYVIMCALVDLAEQGRDGGGRAEAAG
jgi:hypothetical protein